MGNTLGITSGAQHVEDWRESCALQFNCTSAGLLTISGPLFNNSQCAPNNLTIPKEVWGVTYEACLVSCQFVQSTDFLGSATALATWFLPWLALASQLPFEASDPIHNVTSGLLSVGSPALLTYSLMLTVLNKRHVRRKFEQLENLARTAGDEGKIAQRISLAMTLTLESYQAPIRPNNADGWLTSMVVLSENHEFWESAVKDLKKTRRGFTYSFFAQTVVAILSYLLSFITFTEGSFGTRDFRMPLQFSSSIIWTWMFPLVYGYVKVGSQYKSGTIKAALSTNRETILFTDSGVRHSLYGPQKGIIVTADIIGHHSSDKGVRSDTETSPISTNLPSRNSHPMQVRDSACIGGPTSLPKLLPNSSNILRIPKWFGLDVRGDETLEGPVFNYARVYTWFHCAQKIHYEFHRLIRLGQCSLDVQPSNDELGRHFRGSSSDPQIQSEPFGSQFSCNIKWNMFCAAIMGIIVQWGTTGAAIFVAYKTPSIGLGCSSGSYVLYGVLSTLCWACLVFSAHVSNVIIRLYDNDPHLVNCKKVSLRLVLCRGLAITSRLVGKALSAISVAWLFTSSIMENVGAFNNCWCNSNYLQYGKSGCAVVFMSAADMRADALIFWVAGFVFSILACTFSGFMFNI